MSRHTRTHTYAPAPALPCTVLYCTVQHCPCMTPAPAHAPAPAPYALAPAQCPSPGRACVSAPDAGMHGRPTELPAPPYSTGPRGL